MNKNNSKMMCDAETGVCGVSGDKEIEFIDLDKPQKHIDVYYITDPICSHCWALEPVINRFRAQYGHYFNFHTVMGGLLEKWSDDPVDPANGISKPSDVAEHWREVGASSRMPIDGTLWYDDPIHSSYPPSRVFNVIRKQYNEELANIYLRRTRQELFAFNKNIADSKTMIAIINEMGLNGEQIVREAEEGAGQELLDENFQLAASLGVRGFPTIVMVDKSNKGVKVIGARSLAFYVDGLKKLSGEEEVHPGPTPDLSDLLQQEKILFSKEIEVMFDLEKDIVGRFIENELNPKQYEENEILNERYITWKK